MSCPPLQIDRDDEAKAPSYGAITRSGFIRWHLDPLRAKAARFSSGKHPHVALQNELRIRDSSTFGRPVMPLQRILGHWRFGSIL